MGNRKQRQMRLPFRPYDPGTVEVDFTAADMYICTTTLHGNTFRVMVPPPEEYGTYEEWGRNLEDYEVEAGIQIFYDRWNFGQGEDRDKEAYETLVAEREHRKQSSLDAHQKNMAQQQAAPAISAEHKRQMMDRRNG